MSLTLLSHFFYSLFCVVFTVWTGRILFRNGRVFLCEALGKQEMADSVNALLLMGFYLVNFGFMALFLHFGERPETVVELVEFTVTKIGVVLVVLGGMHYFNVYNIAKIRRRARDRRQVQAELEMIRNPA